MFAANVINKRIMVFKYNPIKGEKTTINGKVYQCIEFAQKSQKSGNTCPCYECDVGMENIELCKSINCITETEFLILKTTI